MNNLPIESGMLHFICLFFFLSFSIFARFNSLFSLSFFYLFFINIFFLLWCRRQTHRIYSHFIFHLLSFFIRFVGWQTIIDGILVGISTSHHSSPVIPILRYISAEWAPSSSLFVVCLFFSLKIFISIPLCIFLFPLLRLLFLSTPWKSIVIYDYMMCMRGSVCVYIMNVDSIHWRWIHARPIYIPFDLWLAFETVLYHCPQLARLVVFNAGTGRISELEFCMSNMSIEHSGCYSMILSSLQI